MDRTDRPSIYHVLIRQVYNFTPPFVIYDNPVERYMEFLEVQHLSLLENFVLQSRNI
jgi:hypothetical protein